MAADQPTADIEAVALVRADPEDVFEFLSDLRNHWRLADRFVTVVTLATSDHGGAPTAGPCECAARLAWGERPPFGWWPPARRA